MNIDIRWDSQKRNALICEFKGDWTWHECREAMQVMHYMQDGLGTAVDHIYDISSSTLSTRPVVKRLHKLLSSGLRPAPRQIVIVDKEYRANMLRIMLGSIANPLGIEFVESINTARDVLNQPYLV